MLNWPKLCLRLDRMNRPDRGSWIADRGSHFSTSQCYCSFYGWVKAASYDPIFGANYYPNSTKLVKRVNISMN